MIQPSEIRWGNTVLQKKAGRIQPVSCTGEQFALIAQGQLADLYPVVLKAELLLQNGFAENKEYALYPQAREFRRVLPVKGKAKHELLAYVKSNGECLAWATVDGIQSSNNIYQLHQLQNLHFALTGTEL
ncbi:MAG: hypothetical protein EOP50_08800 [Sphingobacteriales bacterium]|nr:MAG: hypothetical protein EOP50_08800 [Sphingobacteriales bacterium]